MFFFADGDAYDEMLTREEIQTTITKMNLLLALERVEECVKNFDLQVTFYTKISFVLTSKFSNWY
jgi:hypothetical protein